MAVKKSELYSSLWASCDELRGGMDASQYKDYVLTMLFIKYVSDKYASNPYSVIEIPEGASFEDMVALKGKSDIGDKINKQILQPLFSHNDLEGQMELVDFNDDDKLGSGQEKVDRLSKLIAIFENQALNFKNNRAEDDDILGDAYEYLMRSFATQSGKSKGQFYTPSEVSRILSKIISVEKADKPSYTAYDPTCGSGSLLLKVAEEAPQGLTLYGQEKDIATKSLAIMNMWLHGRPEASIAGKNTLAEPQFREKDGSLKRFDFVVANPPFSLKNWSSGVSTSSDPYHRFQGFGVPPDKNGDYAFLLHITASLKSTGKAAVILPHGVLFRGNAEGVIRKNLIERKWIKGIIGLPANLFYGTGIPACIIVVDKEKAEARNGVFMIDASKGFMKDGNKNRLREQDIHKIVDVFNNNWELQKYARLVPFEEIEANEFNLNIPRYIDTQEDEDIQDLEAHLKGGIPERDITAMAEYWDVYPNLKNELFEPLRTGYEQLKVAPQDLKEKILAHPEFVTYQEKIDQIFKEFVEQNRPHLLAIKKDTSPKEFIKQLSQNLLELYSNRPLIIRYDVFQHLMNYWAEQMKDDVYLIIEEGWQAKTYRILEKGKNGKTKDKGWTCDLIPKELVIAEYLTQEDQKLKDLQAEQESLEAELTELEEEHDTEEGAFSDLDKVNKANVTAMIKELKAEAKEAPAMAAEPELTYGDKDKTALEIAQDWKRIYEGISDLKKEGKEQEELIDEKAYAHFQELTEKEVQELVIDKKWLARLKADIDSEIEAISQRLTGRLKELADRYADTLPNLEQETEDLEMQVKGHLEKMGLVWK
ncbi:MAG: type I restriction-modification system subunit M [Bacteroidota bacterium]